MAAGHDVFISYSSGDRARVAALARLFEDRGWSVWWDRDIPPGESYHQVIERALAQARVVVVAWSRTSVESDWVLAEADEGRKRKVLVPALLEPAEIPLAFRSLQAADLAGWSGDPAHTEARKLLAKVAALLDMPEGRSERGKPPAPPKPPPRGWRALARRAGFGALAAAILAAAVFFGHQWYVQHRFESALETVRRQIQWAEQDIGAGNRGEARKKLDAAQGNLDRLNAQRPGAWQIAELQRIYAQTRRRLYGLELSPKLKLDQDCPECPQMVEIPLAPFEMGSPEGDTESYPAERPRHRVAIARPFAIGRFEVTVREFALFAEAARYEPARECRAYVHPDRWERDVNANWKWPQYAQAPDHPVACVSWHDARAYAAWLSRKTGKVYRLPTEAEWEYAVRAGKSDQSRPWGDNPAEACDHANVADKSARVPWKGHGCDDKAVFTAPVGNYPPNRFGLHDMIGNVWEWVQDCFAESYAGAPADGSAVEHEGCKFRVIRGGAWLSQPRHARSAQRGFQPPEFGNYSVGFRVVREN